jgi:hypothetical protein
MTGNEVLIATQHGGDYWLAGDVRATGANPTTKEV